MAFSRKALNARSQVRKDAKANCGYVQILREGEKAYLKGFGLDANPYQSGTEDAEIWAEGWEDARDTI
jgi:ribosome modulation factor